MAADIKQLGLNLEPRNPYGREYWVMHSGVFEATERLGVVLEGPGEFRAFYLYGPEGVGKTHLAKMFASEGEGIFVVDGLEDASRFVSTYEEARRSGGVFLFLERELETNNPHITSRLQNLIPVGLSYPTQEELKPILVSLAERFNLKIPDSGLEYLLKRLPLKPLSFKHIFARLNDLCLEQGKEAGLRNVALALKLEEEEAEGAGGITNPNN